MRLNEAKKPAKVPAENVRTAQQIKDDIDRLQAELVQVALDEGAETLAAYWEKAGELEEEAKKVQVLFPDWNPSPVALGSKIMDVLKGGSKTLDELLTDLVPYYPKEMAEKAIQSKTEAKGSGTNKKPAQVKLDEKTKKYSAVAST